MNKAILAVALSAGLILGGPALAADNPNAAPRHASPAEPAAPSAKAIDLARRYFVALHMDERMRELMKSLVPVMIEEESKSIPGITAPQKEAISEATQEAMADWFPRYMDRVAVIYARVFTQQELQALVDFYETPIGKSVVQKSGTLAPEATRVMQAGIPEFQALIAERMCRKLDCSRLRVKPATSPS